MQQVVQISVVEAGGLGEKVAHVFLRLSFRPTSHAALCAFGSHHKGDVGTLHHRTGTARISKHSPRSDMRSKYASATSVAGIGSSGSSFSHCPQAKASRPASAAASVA